MPLSLTVEIERWPIAGTFTIARGSRTEAVVVVARVSDGTHTGRGECTPYARYGETPEGVAAAIEAFRQGRIEEALAIEMIGRCLCHVPLRACGASSCAPSKAGAKRLRPAFESIGIMPTSIQFWAIWDIRVSRF